MADESNKTSLLIRIRVRPDAAADFAAWQSKWHSGIASAKGFIDLEIFCPAPPLMPEWILVQRFDSNVNLNAWRASDLCKNMMQEVADMTPLKNDQRDIQQEEISEEDQLQGGVTQVFVTRVASEKVKVFLEWIGKMHEAEAKAKGFRRVFVQAPKEGEDGSWITLLQFDTQKNLDAWLESKERQIVLNQLEDCISSIESHRVTSSFAGWFSSVAEKKGVPVLWKQTMLVLLLIYPIVMLEIKFLNPYTAPLGLPVSTFIANAISVVLLSWPFLPAAIYLLYWWLYPEAKHERRTTILGSLLVAALYLIEIGLFAVL